VEAGNSVSLGGEKGFKGQGKGGEGAARVGDAGLLAFKKMYLGASPQAVSEPPEKKKKAKMPGVSLLGTNQ